MRIISLSSRKPERAADEAGATRRHPEPAARRLHRESVKAPIMTNSPCAMLMMFIRPKTIASPSATSTRMLNRVRALRRSGIKSGKVRPLSS